MKHNILSKRWLALPVLGLLLMSSFSWSDANLDPSILNCRFSSIDTLPPIHDRSGNFVEDNNTNPVDLADPSAVQQEVEYDPSTGMYIVREKIGDDYFRMPTYMTFEEYLAYKKDQQQKEYFESLAGVSSSTSKGIGLKFEDPVKNIDVSEFLTGWLGNTDIEFKTDGNIDVTFGGSYNRVDNPTLTNRARKNGGLKFDFDMDLQVNASGQIGDKIKLNTNYNTQKTFDFEDQIKLEYNSLSFSEDEIIKNVDLGNVNLPLKSSLIQGSQNLLGVRTDLQFGHLKISTIAAIQRGKNKDIQIQGGAQKQYFEVDADQYDENRHFFLSHFHRDHYEDALINLPNINALTKVNRIQVWITNDRNVPDNVRNILAVADLGESDRIGSPNVHSNSTSPYDITGTKHLADNSANDLFTELKSNPDYRVPERTISTLNGMPLEMESTTDFEFVQGRLLNPNEYSYHDELGFISVNINVQPDQVLAVAYEYDYNGQTYKVGEFSDDISTDSTKILFVKMLKSTATPINRPIWDLMMKNVYSLGAYQVNSEDFKLDLYYQDPGAGLKRFLPKSELSGVPLLNLFNLDRLNSQLDRRQDGVFDFVPGVTINPQNGRVILPVLEPFGSSLAKQFTDPSDPYIDLYTYPELYDSTITQAREYPEKNRFVIKGSYKSSVSSEINLNVFNIPEGSVRVRAGAQQLKEGQDFTVDYNIGRVKILNDAILASGVPVNISFEDFSNFNFQTKTMLGLRADYAINKDFNIGATYMHLFEKPFTQKVNIGDDPINNRVFGLDVNFSKKAPWLTRFVDKIPLIDTKAESNISFVAEAAAIKPGHSRAIDLQDDAGGSVYIDDFEGSTSDYSLNTQSNIWKLASIPQKGVGDNMFPESVFTDSTITGVNRARLNWYVIEQTSLNQSPDDPYTATVTYQDLFPNRQNVNTFSQSLRPLDLTYYPDERGPYNFDPYDANNPGTEYSAGLNVIGKLNNPASRWAGIMRQFDNTDFQAANFEYIEFWVLNPFMEKADGSPVTQDGKLFIDLGNVSEDVIKDGRRSFENGLPKDNIDVDVVQTHLARVSTKNDLTHSFDNDPDVRVLQDVGLDGLDDAGETIKFDSYLQSIQAINTADRDKIMADPSADNFKYFQDYPDDTDILERYEKWNGTEGNSDIASGNTINSSTSYPDSEDLNRDNNLNQSESFFEYEIDVNNNGQNEMEFNDFVIDSIHQTVANRPDNIWYRVKVPIHHSSKVAYGPIQDFRSIRFIRMYLKDFDQRTTFRFAEFDLVRNQWRRYTRNTVPDGPIIPNPNDEDVIFDVNSVNIEENSDKTPFNYVLPPGISREQGQNSFANTQLNEQAIAMNVEGLKKEHFQAIYKNLNLDMRQFDTLKMFIHGEEYKNDALEDGEMSVFMRLGSDFENNYYEYEIPLKITRDVDGPSDLERQEQTWLKGNEFNFSLKTFKDIKLERNNSGVSLEDKYVVPDGRAQYAGNNLSVIGNPNMGEVRSIMIGIKNTDASGATHNVEVWANELRVTGLDESGGVAALARLDMQLADFGNLAASVNYSSIGYGAIDKKLAQRSREASFQYDFSGNFELGKFLPEKWKVSVPFYAQYSSLTKTPQYDPYDLDIPLKEKLAAASSDTRDSIKSQAIDRTTIKSYNFTNVKKQKSAKNKKNRPWDISNISASYGYSQTARQDPIIERDEINKYKGGLDYTYANKAKYLKPFKKLIKKDKYLKLLTEFGINPVPNALGFNTVLNKQQAITKYRFTEGSQSTYYEKRFTWDRNYNLKWDLTKQLKFSFNASNKAIIDEPLGEITTAEQKDTLWSNIKSFGRNKQYTHNVNVKYEVPFKRIPYMDWVKVNATYDATYGWDAAAKDVLAPDSLTLGNVIQNSQKRSVNGNLDFTKLYKKSGYLAAIQKTKRKKKKKKKKKGAPDDKSAKSGAKKSKKKKKKKTYNPSTAEKWLIRPLLAIRKLKVNYSEDFRTVIPGFLPQSEYLGQGENFSAPGWNFIGGGQPKIKDNAAQAVFNNEAWFTKSVYLNQKILQNYKQTYDIKLTLEPFKDFKVDVDMKKSYTDNYSEQFKVLEQGGDFEHVLPTQIGSLNMTYGTLGTFFDGDYDGLFQKFEDNREVISNRLGISGTVHAIDGSDFTKGYGKKQQEVLIPAFLAAYQNTSANTTELDILRKGIVPAINWRLSYNGLSKLPALKDIVKSFTLRHAYKSNLNVNSFQTSRDFIPSTKTINEETGDYYQEFRIPDIVITESFSPLIGIDMKLKNDMSIRFDYKKSRNMTLSFIDYKLNEAKSDEYVFGFSYKIKGFKLPWLDFIAKLNTPKYSSKKKKKKKKAVNNKKGGKKGKAKNKVNNLNFDLDFSRKDDISLIHEIDGGASDPTRGSVTFSISPSIDYDVNKNLNLRLFFDYRKTTPHVSSSYPITNAKGGLTIRLQLN